MTKELMELADEYAILRQLTDECASSARAVLKSAIEKLQAENERTKSAIKTLEYLGYTNHGGEFWKPPLGKAPDFALIDSIRAERDALAAKLDELLKHCPDPECLTCGEIICPHGEPLHFHHDGCPACEQPAAKGGQQ